MMIMSSVSIYVCLYDNILQVESEQTNLLKHPLVNALLDYKWRKYTQLAFAINMLIYFTFVVLLTSFALVVHTPQDRACEL